MHFDVVVVGARCAGASFSAFLARNGARVLLLDQARLPSDQPLSTHTIHPVGMDVLDELGVGATIRSAPAVRRLRLRKNEACVDAVYPEGRVEYCPRRLRLDTALLEAALSSGVELRDQARVHGLIVEGGRVRGVRFRSDGRDHSALANWVVGADGRHSLVARAAGAEEYLAYDAPRAMYWSYFPAPPFWTRDSAYAFDMYFGHIERAMRVIFQTDDGQLLLGSVPELPELAEWKASPEAKLRADLSRDPLTAPLVEGRLASERVRAITHARYFFRQGVGAGWALLGDAGIHKDFLTGDGISEALIQARSLARAVARGHESCLIRWWRERDVLALPLYCFGQDQGRAGAVERLDELVFERVARDPVLCERIALGFDHQISPYDALPLSVGLKVVGGALLRRQWELLAQFQARGRRRAEVVQELARRRRLLDDTE